ncbi:hypothetical protein [Alteromonas mediterranea]|uniref:Uncharacterized protein n=1 Tax=Alteromonas mediterranea (strain DSM 17117 / CIP 110805 / LMG 28347 / Deep ecotype) TaxID=1774373 RepID=F2G9M6_ALTMD|nr:hypothetical protein [Alteromonas mediterranea]AEA98846.1 hypothetical protein MADE_1013560 [Alteromonas mediterranea DE]CAH1194085.1 hypothetical protein ISS312_02337 [Alteromonas mediterranea]|tara:strand:- start:190 stop:846 length:657 start_codon:yes stop_codon:yes gene_type:complete
MLGTTQLEQNHSPSNKQVPQRTFAALITPLLAVLLLVTVPLVESLHGGVLWGLNYHSPKFMSQVGDALALVKLIALCAGVYLLFTQHGIFRLLVKSKWLSIVLSSVLAIVALIQIAIGLIGVLIDATLGTNRDYFHKEFAIENNTIYVFTADPGAMGTAYHYFYLKCPLPLNRYKLELIDKAKWVGDVELKDSDDGFDVFNQRDEFGYRVSLGGVGCG